MKLYSSSEEHRRILRMYQSFFGRTPDIGGANYWIDRYDRGLSIADISRHFMFSNEFKAKYDGLNDIAFLKEVYRNVLDREGDIGGINYWYGRMRNQGLERNRLIEYFSDSDEFRSRVPYHDSPFTTYVKSQTGTRPLRQIAPGVLHCSFSVDVDMVFIDPEARGNLDVSGGTRTRAVGYYGGAAAINGNWFGSYLPRWFAGYSISNGVALGSVDGDTRIGWIGESVDDQWEFGAYNGANVPPDGIEEAVSGKILVQNGVKNPWTTTKTNDPTLLRADPRAGIGLRHDDTLIMVSVNGRRYGGGMTADELARMFVLLGVEHAMMMDGGGSATLYTSKYGIVNKPSDGTPRRVSNQMMYRTEGHWVV